MESGYVLSHRATGHRDTILLGRNGVRHVAVLSSGQVLAAFDGSFSDALELSRYGEVLMTIAETQDSSKTLCGPKRGIPHLPMPGGPGFYVLETLYGMAEDLLAALMRADIPAALLNRGGTPSILVEVSDLSALDGFRDARPVWGGQTVSFADDRMGALVDA
jgi:hypothetical protein